MNRRLATQFSAGPQLCYRCERVVYPTEKVGPVNEAVFHKNCFRCHQCGVSLSLSSYCSNPVDSGDRNVYCASHRPQLRQTEIDAQAVGVRTALSAQNFYNKTRDKDSEMHRKSQVDAQAISIKQAVTFTRMRNEESDTKALARCQVPTVELQSVGIQGAVRAQKLRKDKKATFSRHHYFPQLVEQRRKEIREAQENLERRHRQEEDSLFKTLQEERQLRERRLSAELKDTWQVRLQELASRQAPEKEKEELKQTIRFAEQERRGVLATQIQEQAEERTAELVARQSKEMLLLLAQKQREIENEVVQLEEKGKAAAAASLEVPQQQQQQQRRPELQTIDSGSESNSREDDGSRQDTESDLGAEQQPQSMLSFIPDRVPSPCPPSRPKAALYENAEIFKQLDEHVINIAEEEQLTFTELSDKLASICMSDLEKVRAIFRWITVKDLSAMDVDRSDPDTPLGLLRGIRYGTERYHVLFMRLCSYAGVHAVEIKGYSKSVGYEPGMTFRNAHKFKNTWNAVLVDGDWRLVQCNWAARRFVLNKSTPGRRGAQPEKADNLRYDYDEHYFLTDPEKFIFEFFPFEAKWQLLETPISLEEFEDKPFVRSLFFDYGMEFPSGTKAILEANDFGGAKLEICLKDPSLPLQCHYQLRCAETGEAFHQGARLDRFVFLTVPTAGSYIFDIHVPNRRPYMFEIFAGLVEANSPAGSQTRLRCVAKFKVVAPRMQKRMTPLPQSSSSTGEWGPSKAVRHFGVKPMTHASAVVNFDAAQSLDKELAFEFWVPDGLIYEGCAFSALVHKNGLTCQLLSRYVKVQIEKNVLVVRFRPPEDGQYSLEVFLERSGQQSTHVCKYLVRCSNLPARHMSAGSIHVDESAAKSGASGAAKKLGLAYHSDVKFKAAVEASRLNLQFSFKDELDLVAMVSRFAEGRQAAAEDHSDNCEIRVVDRAASVVPSFVTDGKYHVHLLAKRPSDTNFELCYTFKLDVRLPKAVLN